MDYSKIILKDTTITDPRIGHIAWQGIAQVNGFPSINDRLMAHNVFKDAMAAIETFMDDEEVLDLPYMSLDTLKKICKIAVQTLEHYEDLEIVLGESAESVHEHLDRLLQLEAN